MADNSELPQGWERIRNPASLFRRFEFDAYSETSEFLDRLAKLSEATGLYPDLNFGKTYANVTVSAADAEPSKEEIDFAHRVNEVANAKD